MQNYSHMGYLSRHTFSAWKIHNHISVDLGSGLAEEQFNLTQRLRLACGTLVLNKCEGQQIAIGYIWHTFSA